MTPDKLQPSVAGLLTGRQRAALAWLAAAGALALAVAWPGEPVRAGSSLLVCAVYLVSLGVIGALFVAVHSLASAGWLTVLRRVPEAVAGVLPAGAVLLLGALAGAGFLFHGSHPEAAAGDAVLREKAAWLDHHGVLIRAAVCLAAWCLLSRVLVCCSRRQDETGDPALTRRHRRMSAVFAVVFGVTFSVAAMDWLMALEPHWFSTLYPWYVFSSVLAGGAGLIAGLTALLRHRGVLPQVNEHHLHDLGKYVFAFSLFWGYLWYSQYMLIWYANLPEETPHYLTRLAGPWRDLFALNVAVNVAAPFFLLLPAGWKRNPGRLLVVGAVVAAGHGLDLYLLVAPAVAPGPSAGLPEIGAGAAAAALLLLLFDRAFRAASPVPFRDPFYAESLHPHG
jgi:hypothetical protein